MDKGIKLEFMGGKIYRLYVGNSDRFDIVRFISEIYRDSPADFSNVVIEVVYDVNHPLTSKDKNFIKWRVRSFTAGNVNVTFTENVSTSKEEDMQKVIPLRRGRDEEKVLSSGKIFIEDSYRDVEGLIVDDESIRFLINLGTMRSGNEITSDDGVIIVGDVHMGADIYSEGPVYILGTLSGRIFLMSSKAYAIVKTCEDGMIVYNGKAYECGENDEWILFLPNGEDIERYTGRIGELARRVKKWQEEL